MSITRSSRPHVCGTNRRVTLRYSAGKEGRRWLMPRTRFNYASPILVLVIPALMAYGGGDKKSDSTRTIRFGIIASFYRDQQKEKAKPTAESLGELCSS